MRAGSKYILHQDIIMLCEHYLSLYNNSQCTKKNSVIKVLSKQWNIAKQLLKDGDYTTMESENMQTRLCQSYENETAVMKVNAGSNNNGSLILNHLVP